MPDCIGHPHVRSRNTGTNQKIDFRVFSEYSLDTSGVIDYDNNIFILKSDLSMVRITILAKSANILQAFRTNNFSENIAICLSYLYNIEI